MCLRKVVGTTLFALLAGSVPGVGAQTTPGHVSNGLRIFVTGHSFHVFVAPMLAELVLAAGIEGHEQVGLQSLGGSTVMRHWDVPDSVNTAKAALMSGGVDVFTMSPVVSVPDEGIARFLALGLERNP